MKRCVTMATLFLMSMASCTSSQESRFAGPSPNESFTFRVLSTGLADPWELLWGPDGFLWVTEKSGKRVVRVNPSDGSKTTVITIPDVYISDRRQDGLLGMALHPGFLAGVENNYVYLAYTYNAHRGGPVDPRAKIARYTYDPATKTLSHPVELITGLPASNAHNAGRLLIGHDQRLYYSTFRSATCRA
jgi:glucose/arabinose dehydrogenase